MGVPCNAYEYIIHSGSGRVEDGLLPLVYASAVISLLRSADVLVSLW